MPGCIIRLPALDAATEVRLDRYLEMCASPRDRPALKELYRRLVLSAGSGLWPRSPAQLFGSSKSPAYKLFSNKNAASIAAQARTKQWSEAIVREPALITTEAAIVDLSYADWTGGAGWVAKLGVVLGAGVQPIEITRTYRHEDRHGRVVQAVRRMREVGHRAPLLTTRPEDDLVSLMLDLAVLTDLEWTGRVSDQYEFPGALAVKWFGAMPMQTLSVADALAAVTSTDSAAGAFAWAQINRRCNVLLYGPSALGRYYIRHCVGGTAAEHQRETQRLVKMVESRELCLSDFAIEDLKVLAKDEDAYVRLTRGILLMWRFALHAPAGAASGEDELDISEST